MQFIRSARRVGFSLRDIARILILHADGHRPCQQIREELHQHLQAVRQQLTQFQALQAQLAGRRASAQMHPDPECEAPGCVYLKSAALARLRPGEAFRLCPPAGP